jgi:hypothetical protein
MLHRRMMHDGPRAMNHALSFEEVAEHRNLACGRYGMCLEVVVRRQWTSFTCRLCSLWMRPHPLKAAGQPGQLIYLPAVGQR